MYLIEEIERGDMKAKIYQDESPESPREWGNLGTMISWHRRYTFDTDGNKEYPDSNDFLAKADAEGYLMLPLYLYDHSGLRMRTGSFHGLLPQGHAEFDSGQVGWIYVTREAVKKEYGVKRITKKVREQALRVLQAEVETYDQYLCGDIYGYQIEDSEGEHEDSCWGFYGIESVREEATRQLEYWQKEKAEAERMVIA